MNMPIKNAAQLVASAVTTGVIGSGYAIGGTLAKILETGAHIAANPFKAVKDIVVDENAYIKIVDANAVLKESLDSYQYDMGLKPNGIFDAEAKGAFIIHDKQKPKTSAFFNNIKDDTGTPIEAKLQAKRELETPTDVPTAAQVAPEDLRADLDKVLEPTAKYITAKNDYSLLIDQFEAACAKMPLEGSAQGMAFAVQARILSARKAIEEQQNVELERLLTQFDGPLSDKTNPASARIPPPSPNPFRERITAALGTTDTESVKKQMVANLQASHQKQLDEFDKPTQAAQVKLFDAVNKQAKRDAFLNIIYAQNDKEMREKMRKAQEPVHQGTINITLGPNNKRKFDISSVKIEKLEFIKSLTGKKILQTEPGKFQLIHNRRIFDNMYYANQKKPVVTDMMVIAGAVKASGFQKITMTVNYPKPASLEMKRAREAYEACIKAGYAKEDIYIKLSNGTVYTADPKYTGKKNVKSLEELFQGEDSATLSALYTKEAEIAEEEKKAPKFDDKGTIPLKDRLGAQTKAEALLQKERATIKDEAAKLAELEGKYPEPKPPAGPAA